jgi:hypothetical protein
LRENGINAVMAFYGDGYNDPMHPNYKKYRCPWTLVRKISDDYDVCAIAPETAVDKIIRFKKAKKIIYWLAVDNYVLSLYRPSKLGFIQFTIKKYFFDPHIVYAIITGNSVIYYNAYVASYVKSLIDAKAVSVPDADLHLVQSLYAKEFLSSYDVGNNNIVMIREPLEEEFLERSKEVIQHEKIDVVAFNARKAYPLTFKLVKALRRHGIVVLDLKNVGKDRMIKILSKSKIFLDIGLHPGRDRPPREAVVLDNITIVNNHGGCYHFADCMIPVEFKWNCYLDQDINYHKSIYDIEHYLENYEYYIKKFYSFKQYILQEPSLFINDTRYLTQILMKWGVN